MSSGTFDFSIAMGGAAGQGIATPGNTLARIFIQRGLHFDAYNAFQSIVRGGHILLTMRVSDEKVYTHGDKIDMLVCLNQDTMDRHLKLMEAGTYVIYNSDTTEPGEAADGVNMCPMPINELTNNSRNRLYQNTAALGMIVSILKLDFKLLEDSVTAQFLRRGQDVVDENVGVARAAYDHAEANYPSYAGTLPTGPKPLGVWTGNDALAMGGAAAGVNFYAAYPMSPSTGVLHWMATHARDLGILVRQVEDEISVANMVVGAAHAGSRSMCATSGGGFALMTEAIGMAGMMELPCVFIDVMRAGPSTGVPTKTEQGDLWQALGASQGDFQRVIVAPKHALDAYNTIPELFNLLDKFQCPGIVLTDQLVSEGTFSVDPDEINMNPVIDRGELITESDASADFMRYKNTESGISPRALPGLEGYIHVVATDEHDENSLLISDEFTNPTKRRAMVEKRSRKLESLESAIEAPQLEGPADADVTLIGWGSTYGVINEAAQMLNDEGISTNFLSVKWLIPLHGDAISEVVNNAKRTIIVENNESGQFYRYLRSETGLSVDGHIRKYDGEPFMPHHIVNGVKEQLAGNVDLYVPVHEILV